MKKRVLLGMASAILFTIFSLRPALAEPFAPRADVPDELLKGKNASLDAFTAKHSKIPDRKEVGVPAYPGAKVLSAQPSNDMKVNGKPMKSLAHVVLGTTESIAEVAAFYTDKLSGWQTRDFFGSRYFWQTGEFSPLSEEAMTTPHLFIREPFKSAPNDVMPGANAIIEIFYYPSEE